VSAAFCGVTLFDAAEAAPVPVALVAVTVKVYAVPFVRPDTVMGLAVPVPVIPLGLEVAVKPDRALPPVELGAVKAMIALALPAVAVPMVGAPGTVPVAGVTLFDAAEATLVPMALVAVTVKVYAVPFVRPLTVIGAFALPVPVNPPGLEVAV
jgi:hypothetical protein